MKRFFDNLEKLSSRHSRSRIFSDFLGMVVCSLSMQTQEELYLQIVGKYERKELDLFCESFALLVMEMDNRGEGLKDCLGDYFQEYISNGNNGQFFTPDGICDLMARMTLDPETLTDGKTINDCACGSGRTLLAAAKLNRNLQFYAGDISLDCCYMTLINFCLNNLEGEVWWIDSLRQKMFGAWRLKKNYLGVCTITKLTIIETIQPEIKAIELKPIERKLPADNSMQLLLDFVA